MHETPIYRGIVLYKYGNITIKSDYNQINFIYSPTQSNYNNYM
jgi:hypothetical protein